MSKKQMTRDILISLLVIGGFLGFLLAMVFAAGSGFLWALGFLTETQATMYVMKGIFGVAMPSLVMYFVGYILAEMFMKDLLSSARKRKLNG